MGLPVTLNNPASAPARAYNDAARRLQGEQVQLVVPSDKVTLFSKLLGRRAA
jgi:septum site-determining protein MinD